LRSKAWPRRTIAVVLLGMAFPFNRVRSSINSFVPKNATGNPPSFIDGIFIELAWIGKDQQDNPVKREKKNGNDEIRILSCFFVLEFEILLKF